jgi:hypothetical protein
MNCRKGEIIGNVEDLKDWPGLEIVIPHSIDA